MNPVRNLTIPRIVFISNGVNKKQLIVAFSKLFPFMTSIILTGCQIGRDATVVTGMAKQFAEEGRR